MSLHRNNNGTFLNGSDSSDGKMNPGNNQLSNAKDDVIDLQHHAYLLWKNKWVILLVTLLFCGVAGLIALLKTPIYQSTGSLMITESKNQYSYAGSDLSNLLTNSYGIGLGNSIIDELQILRSRKLSHEVADTLFKRRYMDNGKYFPILLTSYPDDSTFVSTQIVAARLRSNLLFNQVSNQSNLVNISYQSPSPEEAAAIVNLTISTYSKVSTRQNRRAANAAVNFLSNERERIERELNVNELQLQEYMSDNELVQVDAQTQSVITRIADLEQKRQEAQTKLVAVNSALQQYQEQLNRIKPGLADQFASAVGANMERLQYRLAELKIERTRLLTENPGLNETKPKPEYLQNLDNQIANYQQEIRNLTGDLLAQSEQYAGFIDTGGDIVQEVAELNKLIVRLNIEQKQYQSQVDVLTEVINELDVIFDNLPANMMGLARLKRNVEINEQLYLTVSQQYAEMSLWQQTQFGQGQLVDEGFIPGSPIKPNVQFYLIVGFVTGLLLSVGFIFIRDSYDTTIDGVNKIKKFNIPLLAVIPDIYPHQQKEYDGRDRIDVQGANISTGLISFLNTISPAAEAFRRLETNVLHSDPDHSIKTLLVTSTTKGEGKTFVVANLGVIMAESDQKIVIVDTDLRRPRLHKVFGLERGPGIVDVAFGNATLGEAVKPTLISNLSILPAGKRPTNASAIVKSRAFLKLLKDLEASYDRVLIDTPPFGIITDSSTFMDQSDGVIVVARFGNTNTSELNHTLDQLARIDANVYGTVLNGFNSRYSTDYYYGSNYYSRFYEDYKAYTDER